MSAEPLPKNEKVHFWVKCVASKRLCSRTLKSPGNRRRLHADQNSLIMSAALLWINTTLDSYLRFLEFVTMTKETKNQEVDFLSAWATEENLPGIMFWNPCPKKRRTHEP